ncbi:MAG TPA: chromosome segregation protein SMC [bacterium]|nr:chromosome segregation protein SMC [bacterium]
MYLKRIELNGFKTFPDLTEVILSPGITSVVGPNGCGKSNLMDAVRWVLGEQRARVLRGGKMEDVIFSGTPQRPGMSAAEVTLIVDNQSGGLPTDFTEVAITRRLDRSGESEYRLNGVPCRLKDIHDLLLDTGMGSHGYAVIQAAMIDAILSENPDERRFLFEEAAGVSKYKVRQKAALRKMEATEQDLLRLTDLKNEVATHVRSLARQKGMAERHRQLRDRWKAVDLALAVREYKRRLEQASALHQAHQQAREESATLSAQVDQLEIEWQALRVALDEAERVAQAAADRLTEATNLLHAHKTESIRWEDRQRHLREDQARLSERRQALTERLAELEKRRGVADYEANNARAARELIAERVVKVEQAYREARDAVAAREAALAEVDAEHTRIQHAHLRLASQREAWEHRREDVLRRREQLRERRDRQTALVAQAQTETDQLTGELEARRAEERALAETHTRLSAQFAEWENEKTRLTEESRQRDARLAELRAGRDLVAELIQRGEGLGQAAAQILADPRWAGRVAGWIDRLHPQHDWRHAVEAALAGRIGAIWCDDPATVAELVAHLASGAQGRATILDRSLLAPADTRPDIQAPEFSGWLSDKIECDTSDRPWVDALLGHVATAADTDAARRLFQAGQGRYAVVTPDGTLFAAPGIIQAGADSAEPLVGRADRLKDFDERIREAEAALASCEQALAALSARLIDQKPALDDAARRLTEMEAEISARQLALEAASTRLAEYRRRAAELDAEWAQQESLGLTDPATDGASETELQTRLAALAAALAEARAALAAAEEKQNQAAAILNQARVEVVESQAKLDAHVTEIRRCEESAAETRLEQESIQARLTEIAAEQETLAANLAGAAARERELQAACDQADSERAATRAEVARRKDAMSGVENRLRELRHTRDDAERKRAQIELELSGLRHDAEQTRLRIQETHGIDPASATIEETADSDDDLREKAESLKQQIDRLGPVNPLALEEYQTEKQRWDFLEKQVGDLRSAKQQLQETIDELNRTAGERFMETFNSARAHFQNVFTELFRGGEADVRLTEEGNPLESPIEIYARPRGKKFIGIRQLSGGERALTALALLFGLYLVKPSPFCILDEVDAPLDDANCGRFLRMIDRFKGRTQFIIVTHNKLTMEAADALYGVTMEQPGISKLVSVRLNRADESAAEPGLAEPRIAIDTAEPADVDS